VRFCILALTLCALVVTLAVAQSWTGPYLLSDSLGGIKPSACKEWVFGDTTCMVWQAFDGVRWDVFGKLCSFQNGNGWGPAQWLSGPLNAVNPAVACVNDGLSGSPVFCCVWEHPANTADIYAQFDTAGQAWSSRVLVGSGKTAGIDSTWPQVMAVRHGNQYDTTWVTWTCLDTDGWHVDYSYNGGDSWATQAVAVVQADTIRHARLGRGHHGLDSGCPLLVWETHGDIFYCEYVGGSWQIPQEVAHSAALDRNPDVISYSSMPFGFGPWVTWESTRDGDTAIYGTAMDTFSVGRRWCDLGGAGSNFTPCGTPAEYTTDYWYPLAAAWASDRDGNTNVYSRTLFSDHDVRVDSDSAVDINPTLTTLGVTEHWCIWQSDRSGNWDIWGSFVYATGVEENREPQAKSYNREQTIVRGVLWLTPATSYKPQATSLLDISGRKVMELHPGANDVRSLAPGVYFIREGLGTKGEGLGKTQKVVVAR
jgi:hypothetical protein